MDEGIRRQNTRCTSSQRLIDESVAPMLYIMTGFEIKLASKGNKKILAVVKRIKMPNGVWDLLSVALLYLLAALSKFNKVTEQCQGVAAGGKKLYRHRWPHFPVTGE